MNAGKCFMHLGQKAQQALRLQLLCEISSRISAAVGGALTVEALAYAASINVDFDGADYQTVALTGPIALAASLNRPVTGRAKTVSLILTADGTDRALTYNANWTVIGAAPTQVSASKTGVVSLTAIGPNETDVILAYSEQP
jgi:hypothetical protein